ncbi:MAG: hypothetical protein BGO41_06310 [Clostridiales bacterium 38-18]|nr:MAG: hypothetical protein BGO41_06310 [Clostridiales bacterium 38-18]
MILSICMMVKNEEMNLDRCLSSLKPLLDQVDSELIIVDTGSEDNTIEIAAKYTDKIFHHPWNNNFAEMRNISIAYATGKWILIIDADEELEKPEEITKFLSKPHNPQVTCGAIKLINVRRNQKGRVATELLSQRLFLNDGNFRYEGVVHNVAITSGLTEEIDSILYHYGYNADDSELMEKKFIRTSTLLIEELKKNPENIYYIYQLSVTYHMHGDHNKSLYEINKAYDKIKHANKLLKQHSYVIVQLIKSLIMNAYYEEAIKISDVGLKIEPENFDIYFYKANALFMAGNNEEGIKAYEAYFKLKERFQELEIRRDLRVQLATNNEESVVEALNNLAVVYYQDNEFTKSLQYVSLLIQEHPNGLGQLKSKIEKMYLELCIRTGEVDKAVNFVNSMPHYANLLVELFETFMKDTNKIVDSILNFDHLYTTLVQMRAAQKIENSTQDSLVDEFLEKGKLIEHPCNSEFLYFAFKSGKKINHLLFISSETEIYEMLAYCERNYQDFSEVLINYLGLYSDENLVNLSIHKMIYRFLALKYESAKSELIILKYITSGLKHINTKYSRAFIFNPVFPKELTEEELFFIHLFQSLSSLKPVELGQSIKSISHQFLSMSSIVSFITDKYATIGASSDGLVNLENELIGQIKVLIENGRNTEVHAIINEASQLIKNSLYFEFVLILLGGSHDK